MAEYVLDEHNIIDKTCFTKEERKNKRAVIERIAMNGNTYIKRFAPTKKKGNLEFEAEYFKNLKQQTVGFMFYPNLQGSMGLDRDYNSLKLLFHFKLEINYKEKSCKVTLFSCYFPQVIEYVDEYTAFSLMDVFNDAINLEIYSFDAFKKILCRYKKFQEYFDSETFKDDIKVVDIEPKTQVMRFIKKFKNTKQD